VAREPFGLRRVDEPPSELDQLLQHGLVVGGEYEYNNASRHNGLELNRNRIVGWRRSAMSLHDADQSVHVSPSHDRRAGHRDELQHRHAEAEGQAALVGLLESLLDAVVVDLAGVAIQLGRTLRVPVCGRLGHRLRQRSRGHVTNSDVLTKSSPEQRA
jgi:hypothetical protein